MNAAFTPPALEAAFILVVRYAVDIRHPGRGTYAVTHSSERLRKGKAYWSE